MQKTDPSQCGKCVCADAVGIGNVFPDDGWRANRSREEKYGRSRFRGSVRLNRCLSVRFVCTLSDSVSTGQTFSYSACAASLKPR